MVLPALVLGLMGSFAAETPRETLDKTKFANKVWDALPLLLEERKEDKSGGDIDEMDDMLDDEGAVTLEEDKAKYDPMKPPKGDWAQCAAVGDRTLRPISRTSGEIVRYPPVGDFRMTGSRSTWYRNEMLIPMNWKGRQIRIYAWLWGMDALVYVNGRKAGRILRPRADIDVTDLVKAGERCTVAVLFSTDRIRDEAQKKWFEERYWKDWTCHRFEFRSYDGNAYLTDVFADSSVTDGKLTLESEIRCRRPGEYRLKATITEKGGDKAVKTFDEKLSLKAGLQTVKPSVAWTDPKLWEFHAPHLYTCEVTLCDAAGEVLDRYPTFNFGFREIKRVGRALYMNGHPVCLRGIYTGYDRAAIELSAKMGYNFHIFPHNTESFTDTYQDKLDLFDEMGMGVIANGPNVQPLGGSLLGDPAAQAEYRRQMQMTARSCRNHPSLIAHHLSCNFFNPRYNQFPWALARDAKDKDGKVVKGIGEQVIDMGAKIGREFNPHILFYGHADGNGGDISGANLYLNWTPMQEREDWFSSWAESGDYPYQAAEYGQPYWACWWAGGSFFPVEHAARYFGDATYTEMETVEGMRYYNVYDHTGWGNTPLGAHGAAWPLHGLDEKEWNAFAPHAIVPTNCPALWNYRALLASRSNRAFRTDGVSGGILYFNLGEKYAETNRAFEVQAANNQDLLAYIGGLPRHTNKTHAYAAGETVGKQLVTIWDGVGTRTLSAKVEVKTNVNGKEEGEPWVKCFKFDAVLKAGGRKFDKFSFAVPKVKVKTPAVIEAVWTDEKGAVVASDSFNLEFYPDTSADCRPPGANCRLFLYDPEGKTEPLLKKLGLAYGKIDKLEALTAAGRQLTASRLVIGEFALKGEDYAILPEDLEQGLRVLILRQAQAVWTSLGLRTEQTTSRLQFKRDLFEPAFADIANEELAYWRGTPEEYDKLPFFDIHKMRGPRWLKTHSVSGYSCVIPARLGWHTYIDGEFGLQYGSYMSFSYGRGGLYLTTLDLGCNLDDPAAMKVAGAVFRSFIDGKVSAVRQVIPCGERLTKYAVDHLCCEEGAKTADEANTVYFVGLDAKETFAELKQKCEKGANVLVSANERIAKEAGLVFRKHRRGNDNDLLASHRFYRIGRTGEDPVFRGVGPAQLRWRYGIERYPVESAPDCFKLDADGYAAIATFGKGKFVYVIDDPIETGMDKDYYTKKTLISGDWTWTSTSYVNAHNLARKFCEMLLNLGAKPARAAAERALYRFPMDAMVAPKGAHGKTGAMAVAGGKAEFAVSCERPYAAELKVGADKPFRLVRDGKILVASEKAVNRAGWPVRVNLAKGENRFTVETGGTTAFAKFEREMPARSLLRADTKRLDFLRSLSWYDADDIDVYFFHYW